MNSKILPRHFSFSRKCLLVCVFALLHGTGAFSQFSVTEIITDYYGYWKSGATSVNTVKPDNSHNLLSFSFNGKRYSTGANDLMLALHGQSFIPGDYRALPITSISSAVSSNTKIGLGNLLDGVVNGPSFPAPANNLPYYLTDGIKGLNLGTCVANLPAGTMFFPVSKILKNSIGDAAPDMLVTQIADPSGSMDRYQFTDVDGKVIGNYVDIKLNDISPVGNWTADFYEANQHPMTLLGGFTKTDRPIRLWASDLSAFGIDSTNSDKVAYFKIVLSGNSDLAFVAYNNNSINLLGSLLPTKLDAFSGTATDNQVLLKWSTGSEINSDAFIVEKSTDGANFAAISTIKASTNTNTTVSYSSTDQNASTGKNYYRLKMVDKDGNFDYSKVIVVNRTVAATGSISLYPNPAKTFIVINHPFAGNNEELKIINLQGNMLVQKKITQASFQTRVDLPTLAAGTYELVWSNGKDVSGNRLVIL